MSAGPFDEVAAAHSRGQHTPRLADGDVAAKNIRLVLALERDEVTTRIEHRNCNRLHRLFARKCQSVLDDGRCDGERHAAHRSTPAWPAILSLMSLIGALPHGSTQPPLRDPFATT